MPKPEAPEKIVIGGETYIHERCMAPKPTYIEQGLYPAIMKPIGKKLMIRCYDPSTPRFVVDGIYIESAVLYEHNFSWIGECCSDLWNVEESTVGWRPANEGDVATNPDTGELDVFRNGKWQRITNDTQMKMSGSASE